MGAVTFTISQEYVIGAAVLGAIWAVRLEGRINQQDRQIEAQAKIVDVLSNRQQTFETKVLEDLGKVKEMLASIIATIKARDHSQGD